MTTQKTPTTSVSVVEDRPWPEFSWSNSRASTLDSCKLQYYFQYYGYWNGGKDDAPQLAKDVWAFKQFSTIPQWTGNVVHEIIADHLQRVKNGEKDITIGGLHDLAFIHLDKALEDTMQVKWKTEKECWRLQEFERDGGLTDKTQAAIEKRIFESLNAYWKSEILEYILETKPEDWLSIDERNKLTIGDVPIVAAADFVFRDFDNSLFIIDWKTGKEKIDSITQQLLVYAEVANRLWNARTEDIKLVGVFLAEDARISQYEVGSAIQMQTAFRNRLADSVALMKSLVKNGDMKVNEPLDISNFTRTDKKSNCFWCPYKSVCNYLTCMPFQF